MRPLTQQQRELLTAQVASFESKTDAELVLLVCNRSDSYLYIPTLWAALVANNVKMPMTDFEPITQKEIDGWIKTYAMKGGAIRVKLDRLPDHGMRRGRRGAHIRGPPTLRPHWPRVHARAA